MTRIVLATIVFALVMRGEPTAHRLDEYLQAARVSLARDRIAMELDLTPGASIAGEVVARLDRDGDNAISPAEAAAYGQAVLTDLVLELDDRPVAMTLARVEIASIDEMREGVGVIQLRAFGDVAADVVGRRRLYFRNNHQPGTSVYMVNALVPEDQDVGVIGQIRDALQREVRIEYRVGPRWRAQLQWVLVGVVGLTALTVLRKRRGEAAHRRAIIEVRSDTCGGAPVSTEVWTHGMHAEHH